LIYDLLAGGESDMAAAEQSLVAYIGENVAKGALSYVGGDAAGFVLSLIGGSSGPSTQDLMDEIKHVGEQLTQVQNTLNTMQALMYLNFSLLEGKLAALASTLNRVELKQLYGLWSNVNVPLFSYMNQVNTQYDTFVEYALESSKTPKENVTRLVNDIQNTNSGAKLSLYGIHMLVLGGGSTKGVLQLWAEMIIPLVKAGSMRMAHARRAYIDYYTQIAGAQLKAINLLEESYNAQQCNHLAQAEYAKFRDLMKAQELGVLYWFEQLLYAGMSNGALWSLSHGYLDPPPPGDNVQEYPLIRPTWDYATASQEMLAGSLYATDEPYRPSPMRQEIETLLAASQAIPPNERRVVVWMIFDDLLSSWSFSGTGLNLDFDYTAAEVSISLVGQGHPSIPPSSSSTLLEEASYWMPQYTSAQTTSRRVIQRFVFSVPDGKYVLANMNNVYKPVHHGCFVNPLYISYQLSVSAESPFAFMDFAPWADPIPEYTGFFVKYVRTLTA
jgi:hypothetical protein